jgi:AcrR family transcriptional regulator
MAKARARSESSGPRRLPRGRHALAPEQVQADQRRRLIAAVPGAVAEHGYEAMSVADIVKRAAVSRNAFYNNFADKQECFAVAQEAGHEGLLRTLTAACDPDAPFAERLRRALGAALEALGSDPDLARLLFVEAPSSVELALRHHEWLRRYGDLLSEAAPRDVSAAASRPEFAQVIVGGISTRIASEVLSGDAGQLPGLTPQLSDYVAAFYAQAGT